MKIVVFSGHCWDERRKAGFHQITAALLNMGHQVLFYTLPLSNLLYLNSFRKNKTLDHRLVALKQTRKNQRVWRKDDFSTVAHFTLAQPLNINPAFNRLFDSIYQIGISKLYAEDFINSADIAIFESSPAIYAYKRVLQLNPNIKLVYRVSDDIRLLKANSYWRAQEMSFSQSAHKISCPCMGIYNHFKHLPTAELIFHGIDKHLFDQDYSNPYKQDTINLVFVGISHFDDNFLDVAARLKPEWSFHIIGPIPQKIKRENIIYYGEMAFEKTIPFIKYASVGLQNLINKPGTEIFTDSLKILQYSYYQLPIVVPEFLSTNRPNTISYSSDFSNIKEMFKKVLEYEASKDNYEYEIKDWVEVSQTLVDL